MARKPVTRRDFLKSAAVAAGATALAACAPAATPTAAPAAEKPAAEPTKAPVEPTKAPVEPTKAPEPTAVPPTEAPKDAASVAASLPRKETLYFNGQQWGALKGWNPYSSDNNNALGISQGDNARVTVFETPYMYNMLDGKQYPLLADGDYTWNDARTELTFKLKPAAKWSDGTPVTADDVAYTWATNVKYETSAGVGNKDYIETIEAKDPQTVVVKAKLDANGKAVNPLQVAAYISSNYVVQKAWTEALEKRAGGDAAKLKADTAEDFVASGPYTKFYADDQKVVYLRRDDYWGADASMWGKLPSPMYLAHTIFTDNAAGFLALKAGEVDCSQQFNANVQDLWLKDNLPISTYMQEAPYGICASLPTAYFNMNQIVPLKESVALRKAIAIAVDYDTIIANAMTNQSPTFAQVPRSVMNPTTGEQALYDHDAVKDLQWVGKDYEGAKKLLDDAGIKDTDGDGWREYKGQKLSFKASCPNGWSDWQAAIEIVAAAGKEIGVEITTVYPEWAVYQTVATNASQKDYDIFMFWSNGAGPTNPWGRVRQLMSSEFAGKEGNWNGNWGGYVNPKVDEIITAIPSETDEAKLKEYYTEATKIYLTDVPSFTLMYRPQSFYTVNESVWTNYPSADDGKNIPPLDLTDGYGIAGLYEVTLVA